MTHPTKAPAMTRRDALERARGCLGAVVSYCLDLGLEPDDIDKEKIRTALEMLNLVLRADAEEASVQRVRAASERRTREMNAELPADQREMLELKGMI